MKINAINYNIYSRKNVKSFNRNEFYKENDTFSIPFKRIPTKDSFTPQDKHTQVAKLCGKETNPDNIKEIASLSDNYFKRALSLMKEGYDCNYVVEIAELNDEQYKQVKEVKNEFKDISTLCAYILGVMEKQPYERAKILLKEGANEKTVRLYAENTQNIDINDAIELTMHFPLNMTKSLVRNEKYKSIINSQKYKDNKKILEKLNKNENFTGFGANYITSELVDTDFSIQDMTLDAKISIKKILESLKNEINKGIIELSDEEKKKLNINMLIGNVEKSINNIIEPTDTNKEDIKDFAKYFLVNNSPQTDNSIINADFAKYQKNGLHLQLSRKEYLSMLNNILAETSDTNRNQIIRKLEIKPYEQDGQIYGYDGIINLKELDENDSCEKAVKELSEKFIKNNKVVTGNKETDKILNAIIKGMPEFINIIGKNTHRSHDYSVDIHSLRVLQECLKHPDYKTLKNDEKTCLKLAILMHDMGKNEGQVDKEHQYKSALYSKDIMRKYPLPIEMKDRVYEIIKNHHWNELYNVGKANADETAAIFRKTNDYKMAMILALSDLKGVSKRIYNSYIESLNDNHQAPIKQSIKNIKESGQLLFTDSIVNTNLIPKTTHNGKTYKLLDLTKIRLNEDMGKFGFENGIKKRDIRFLVHMIYVNTSAEVSQTKYSTKIENDAMLSCSYISPFRKGTYMGREFGFLLKSQNSNVAGALDSNMITGRKKNYTSFQRDLLENNSSDNPRQFLPDIIKNALKIDNAEYRQLYEKLCDYKYLSQINDNEIFKVSKDDNSQERKNISGKEIKQAVRKANDALLNMRYGHNEITVYVPKINAFVALVNDINDIPENYLSFISENNLPIILLGKEDD